MLLLALFTACYDPGYAITVWNTTNEEISDAHVRWENFESITGDLPPGIYKVHSGITLDPPKTFDVTWFTADRKQHRKTLNLEIPEGFHGEIVFKIHSDMSVTAAVHAVESVGRPP